LIEKSILHKKIHRSYTDEEVNAHGLLSLIDIYVKDKKVLDCGALQHSLMQIYESKKIWVHSYLMYVCKSVTGIDIEENEVNVLRNDYDVDIRVMDIEKVSLDEKYDVVFAGEIIEHLSSPGSFLDAIHNNLHENSRLIITTPNTFYPGRVFRSLFNNDPKCHEQHVAWYTPRVLRSLLHRHGYKIDEIKYFSLWGGSNKVFSKIFRTSYWLPNILLVAKKK
jgi:2-polyprenyl-3-methyl-5-hydroxy-6-metoxy-1,4-benzoquinol methylase